MKQNILILGASGMLGSMLLDVFSKEQDFSTIATIRNRGNGHSKDYSQVQFRILDAEHADIEYVEKVVGDADWVVNAVGVINSYIHDDNAQEVERAIRVNAIFPHILASAAERSGAKVIQIATDCVYKCDKGKYSEKDAHDAIDVYGKTKSLGEAHFENMNHLRCSIVGPEKKAHLSLLDWFLTQPKGAKVKGFKNHIWNGVTTLHFAKLCLGMIRHNLEIDRVQHIIPADEINKHDLLKVFAEEYNRGDIEIDPLDTPLPIDRTLVTKDPKMNKKIWEAAGYKQIPTIREMVAELAQYKFK